MATSTTPPARTDRRRTSTSPLAVALLHEAQAGSSDAFAQLYRSYRDLITRYVWVRVHHRDAVDDLVHDTFADALAKLATADDDVVSWLLRLASHACYRHNTGPTAATSGPPTNCTRSRSQRPRRRPTPSASNSSPR